MAAKCIAACKGGTIVTAPTGGILVAGITSTNISPGTGESPVER
ncbi:hypothetical protein [Chitinophaga vietnamensis]|nr:hypothetical protein [Chitinophaga vietnamensis]